MRAPVSHGGDGGRGGGRGPSPQLPLPVPFSAGIPPNKYHYIDDLVVILPQNVWEHLYNRCGPRRPGWSPLGQAFSGAGEGLPPCPHAALTRQQKGREAVAGTPLQPCLHGRRCTRLWILRVTGDRKPAQAKASGAAPLTDGGALTAGQPGRYLSPTLCPARVAVSTCCLGPSRFKSART